MFKVFIVSGVGFILENMSRVVMAHLVEAFGITFSSAFASAFHVRNAQS